MRFEYTSPLKTSSSGGLGLALLIVGLGGSVAASAGTSLKQVQISNGSQIDLLFDGKVQKSQIRTEFFNDIIQLSVQDVSVYPAKISSVNGGNLTKIFAYQYAPKLVRCRLTVKGKAESYKDKFEIKAGGKILTIHLDGSGAGSSHEQVAARLGPATLGDGSPAPAPDLEERALLARVLAAGGQPQHVPAAPPQPAHDSITLSAASPTKVDEVPVKSTENQPIHSVNPKLGGARPLPNPMKAFGKMAAVLGVFGLFALALKRFSQSKAEAKSGGLASAALTASGPAGLLSALGRFARKGLSRNEKMIEVLSTHYLGPKKSIAVVRIAGRTLVLGVSNDSINLITQLSGEETDPLGGMDELDLGGLGIGSSSQKYGAGATAAGSASFGHLLTAEQSKPSMVRSAGANAALQYARSSALQAAQRTQNAGAPEPVLAGTSANSLSSVRAQIRNRLEGLKQL